MNVIQWAKGNQLVAGALAASIVLNIVVGLMLKGAWNDSGKFEAALEAQKGETAEAVAANKDLTATIRLLNKSKQDLVDEMTRDKQQAAAVLADRDKRIQDISAKATRERRKWNELINAKPECRAYLDDRLSNYCDDLAGRVWERSHGGPDSVRADHHQ